MDVPIDTLAARLDMQRYLYPQEKIHVTTDKEQYMAGDTIWLRAFVVDASSHQPVDVSRYVYVELHNPFGDVEQRVKIISRRGGYSGYVPLEANMAEGQYMLAAYTMFMENAGQDYFFKKQVSVVSPFSAKRRIVSDLSRDENGKRNLSVRCYEQGETAPYKYRLLTVTLSGGKSHYYLNGDKALTVALTDDDRYALVSVDDEYKKYVDVRGSEQDFDVVFLPEGGYIIAGTENKVAFKAIGSNGLGQDVECVVLDGGGNEITKCRSLHRGIGTFTFVPQKGVDYRAIVRNACGAEKMIELPKASEAASVLRVKSNGGIYEIEVAGGQIGVQYGVLLQERGRLLNAFTIRNGEKVTLNSGEMPAGILQVLLLDSDGNKLSERLVFNRGDGAADAKITADKDLYGNREPVAMNIDLSEFDGKDGSMAVSVTDNSVVTRKHSPMLQAQMLLQGDLKGYVEDANYYFSTDGDTKIVDEALDALMLTQGWCRYDIPKVAKAEYAEPQYPVERGQEISGTIKSYWRNKPLQNASANIIVPSMLYVNAVKSDKQGRFCLNGFDFPDGTKYVLQALNQKGNNEMNFEVDKQSYPHISNVPMSADGGVYGTGLFVNNEYARLNMTGKLSVLLNEIEVKAYKQIQYENYYYDSMLDRWYQGRVIKTFTAKDIENQGLSSFQDVIEKLPGVAFNNDGYLIAVSQSVSNRMNTVLFNRDGSIVTKNIGVNGKSENIIPIIVNGKGFPERAQGGGPLGTVRLKEMEDEIPFDIVDKIVFNGNLVITTKEGTERFIGKKQAPQLKTIVPLGYQRPAEFYSPKYEVAEGEAAVADLRSTVYWNPNVKTGADGKTQFTFYTNDMPSTSYTVTVEGVTGRGELIRAVKTIKVK